MGKQSRAKHNRIPAPVPRFSMRAFSLYRSTWIFVMGILVLSYGAAAMQHSRWNQAENARVHPVFHLWAIILGIALIVLSYKLRKRDRSL